MNLTIKEAAALFGVSVQTLRNWDESGYFRANKTIGGHRRYDAGDVSDFLEEKRFYDVVFSYEGKHLEHIEKIILEDGEKDPRAKACGGFTKGQIGMLLKNQDTAHDEETKVLPLELFYELASSFSSPYLFDTRPMHSANSLITYKRARNGRLVCESEDVCSATYSKDLFECDWDEALADSFKRIIKTVDSNGIKDVIDNASSKITCTQDRIEFAIDDMIKMIDEKTGLKEHKIVVYPPELTSAKNAVKLTDNLKKITGNEYDTFISRFVPENQILVAIKSQSEFGGYVFCPYMIMCKDIARNRLLMRIGKKLLREGSKSFGVITIK